MRHRTTKEQNEELTRVGPGTSMGELLRRYWWPVGFSADLRDKPTLVRLLGEDLALFRDGAGKVGLLAEKCPHRRASLCLGTVSKDGLRCRYHGWLFDTAGTVLQMPGEPESSGLRSEVKQPSYPASELGGVIFAYLGPKPVPVLPRYHVLAAEGERNTTIQSFNDCNWLQCVENGIDPFHVTFLHSDVWKSVEAVPEHVWFERTDFGCLYRAIRPGRRPGEYNYRDRPVVMPGIIFGGDTNVSYGSESQKVGLPSASIRWSVPIDDTHTMNVRVYYRPAGQPRSKIETRRDPARGLRIEPYMEYRAGIAKLGYDLPAEVPEEDATMLDSLGPIADRENENLSAIDGGIVLLRQLLLEQVNVVRGGRDPIGVIRKSAGNEMIVLGARYDWISSEERARILHAAAA